MTRWLETSTNKATAHSALTRRAIGSIFAIRRWRHGRKARKLELIGLPCRAIPYAPETALLVCGFTQTASWIDWSQTKTQTTGARESVGLGFDFPLSDDETWNIAHRALQRHALSMKRVPSSPLPSELGELIHYPYWVLIAEDRRGRLRPFLYDAVRSRACGQSIERAYLQALDAQDGPNKDRQACRPRPDRPSF